MRHAFEIDGTEHEAWLAPPVGTEDVVPQRWQLHGAFGSAWVTLHGAAGNADGEAAIEVDGRRVPVLIVRDGDTLHVHLDGNSYALRHREPLERAAAEADTGAQDQARAPMPGTAVSVAVRAGDAVTRGQALLVMESMKLETTIAALRDGIVAEVHVAPGQPFERDALLVTLAPAA